MNSVQENKENKYKITVYVGFFLSKVDYYEVLHNTYVKIKHFCYEKKGFM